MVYYLYRFLNINGDILYIGRTSDIGRRILKEHFTANTHLPNECYLETEKVEYTEIVYESEEVAYEAILINQYAPKYNIQFKDDGNFAIQLPEFVWKEFKWEYEGQLEFLKKKKMSLIKAMDMAEHYISKSEVRGAITGISDIDYQMPILPQSFTLIAGVSGVGKTTYLLNIALRNARQKKKVLFINLKDSEENLFINLAAIDSGIPIRNLIMKQLNPQEWDMLCGSIRELADLEISFYNKNIDYWNLEKILAAITESEADLVIVDDLRMIEHERNNYVKDKMEYVLKNIRSVALQRSMPVIGTYSIPHNKVYDRADYRPQIIDLEYDSLIKYADNIQLMYKDSFYNKKKDEFVDDHMIEIIIAKNMLDNKIHIANICCANGGYVDVVREDKR